MLLPVLAVFLTSTYDNATISRKGCNWAGAGTSLRSTEPC